MQTLARCGGKSASGELWKARGDETLFEMRYLIIARLQLSNRKCKEALVDPLQLYDPANLNLGMTQRPLHRQKSCSKSKDCNSYSSEYLAHVEEQPEIPIYNHTKKESKTLITSAIPRPSTSESGRYFLTSIILSVHTLYPLTPLHHTFQPRNNPPHQWVDNILSAWPASPPHQAVRPPQSPSAGYKHQ